MPEFAPIAASDSSSGVSFGAGLPVAATSTTTIASPGAVPNETPPEGSHETAASSGNGGTASHVVPVASEQPTASSPRNSSSDASNDMSSQPAVSTPIASSVSSDAGASDTNNAAGGAANSDPGPSADSSSEPSPQDASAGNPEYRALPDEVTLHVIGDSTAATFPESDATHRVGWASVLQRYFGAGVTVDNGALSGRSSKSFMDEGHWDDMKSTLRAGDYVFIQFGHNDEKSEDPTRYTDPATTYRVNLQLYVDDSRAAGAVPVLLTPISRRKFDGTQVVATHGDYPAAVFAVGVETNTPVIDMTEKTRVLLESLGEAASLSLFADGDNTHLAEKGALEVSALAVQGTSELGLPIAQRLAP